MTLYDLTVICSTQKNKEHIDSLLKEHEGEVLDENEIGLKTFSYPVGKELEGFYFQYIVRLSPEQSVKINLEFASDSKIVRHLMLTTRDEKIKKLASLEDKFDKKPRFEEKPQEKSAEAKKEAEKEKPVVKKEPVKPISKKDEKERRKALDEKLEQMLKE